MEKFPTLVLLVGENNLPNILAALTFLEEGGTVYQVHSSQTKNWTRVLPNILHALQPGLVGSSHSVEIDLHNLDRIKSHLSNGLKNIQGSICYNYTGGTKSMVIYTLLELQKQGLPITMVYLFAGSNTFIIDFGDRIETYRPDITFDLNSLLWMHFLNKCGYTYMTETVLPHTARAILELHLGKTASYSNYKTNHLKFLKKGSKSEIEVKFGKTIVGSYLKKFIEKDLKVKDLGNKLPISRICEITGLDVDFIARWFDGSWLEEIIFKILNDNKEKLGISELGYNLTISPPGKVKFELDVFCIIKTMFFGFSCTTNSKRNLNKTKLFEVAKRTSQIAGSEARFALITLSSDPQSLKKELVASVPVFKEKSLVLGCNDIPQYENKITNWILQNTLSESPK